MKSEPAYLLTADIIPNPNTETRNGRIYPKEDTAEEWAEALDSMLDEMKSKDQFGTEGQCDPRGDFRDDEWSMWNIQWNR